jgi:hypothetical protein
VHDHRGLRTTEDLPLLLTVGPFIEPEETTIDPAIRRAMRGDAALHPVTLLGRPVHGQQRYAEYDCPDE